MKCSPVMIKKVLHIAKVLLSVHQEGMCESQGHMEVVSCRVECHRGRKPYLDAWGTPGVGIL